MNKQFNKSLRNYLAWKAPDEQTSLPPQGGAYNCGNKKKKCILSDKS